MSKESSEYTPDECQEAQNIYKRPMRTDMRRHMNGWLIDEARRKAESLKERLHAMQGETNNAIPD